MATKIPCGGFYVDGTSLTFNEDKVLSASGSAPTPATPTTAGVVKQATAVADVTAAPTQAEFNALLAALRTAGIMANS